jgi:hypothetical protein
MTEEQRTEAIVAAILLAGGAGSSARYLLDLGNGTMYERAVLAARRLLTYVEAKTVVPEEHPPAS